MARNHKQMGLWIFKPPGKFLGFLQLNVDFFPGAVAATLGTIPHRYLITIDRLRFQLVD